MDVQIYCVRWYDDSRLDEDVYDHIQRRLDATDEYNGTVSCPAQATDPGAPADITDACGRTVSAVLVGSTDTPNPVTCNGTRVWTYRYTACDGTTTADWTKTYTITYSGGLTPPTNTTATVSCPAQATDPGAPADITDACGRTVSAVLVGSTDTPNPVTCEGTRVWTYRYTACDGTTTADWTHTYTIDDNIKPTGSNPAPTNVKCIVDVPLPNVNVVIDEMDNCGGQVVVTLFNDSNNAGLGCASNPYIVARIYRLTDCANNFTDVTNTITVIDDVIPSITCPDTRTKVLNSTCKYTLEDFTSLATVSDNCGGTPTVTQSPAVGTMYMGEQTVAVTLTATDDCGNMNSCTFNVVLEDNTPPPFDRLP
ncbi:MAG: HYR domain-containing protein [Saprospiraceae bacterium]|nr:HYR domain-containing protein [Candidatus Vicinibacter affinis]